MQTVGDESAVIESNADGVGIGGCREGDCERGAIGCERGCGEGDVRWAEEGVVAGEVGRGVYFDAKLGYISVETVVSMFLKMKER